MLNIRCHCGDSPVTDKLTVWWVDCIPTHYCIQAHTYNCHTGKKSRL